MAKNKQINLEGAVHARVLVIGEKSDILLVTDPTRNKTYEYKIAGLFYGENYKRLCELPFKKLESLAMYAAAKFSGNERQILLELNVLDEMEKKKLKK